MTKYILSNIYLRIEFFIHYETVYFLLLDFKYLQNYTLKNYYKKVLENNLEINFLNIKLNSFC